MVVVIVSAMAFIVVTLGVVLTLMVKSSHHHGKAGLPNGRGGLIHGRPRI
jgi:hypothetical protein